VENAGGASAQERLEARLHEVRAANRGLQMLRALGIEEYGGLRRRSSHRRLRLRPRLAALEPLQQCPHFDLAGDEAQAIALAAPEGGAAPLEKEEDLLAEKAVLGREVGEGVFHPSMQAQILTTPHVRAEIYKNIVRNKSETLSQ
jgi:hypothetical protein